MRLFSTLIAVSLLSAGCAPGYIIRSAYEEGVILSRRKPIEKVIARPQTDENTRSKLKLVLDLRRYAAAVGLNPGGSFSSYSKIDRDILLWVVCASRRDSFQFHQWWFPFVGSVPYKGFFEKQDALNEAAALEQRGYETSVRGAEAFSTLGWFDDPILSNLLRHPPNVVADTVLHETLHRAIWAPGRVEFNESLANFVGSRAAIDFFRRQLEDCPAAGTACRAGAEADKRAAQASYDRELSLSLTIKRLFDALDQLYRSPLPEAEKLKQREIIFEQEAGDTRQLLASTGLLQRVNNAEILQLKFYLNRLSDFEALFKNSGESWPVFLGTAREITEQAACGKGTDPFEILSKRVNPQASSNRPFSSGC